MNDWYLDPPEDLDLPECKLASTTGCEGVGDALQQTLYDWQGALIPTYYIMRCSDCGGQWLMPIPIDYQEPPDADCAASAAANKSLYAANAANGVGICPHGMEHGTCDACDYLSDLAFDAAREDRVFGRSR